MCGCTIKKYFDFFFKICRWKQLFCDVCFVFLPRELIDWWIWQDAPHLYEFQLKLLDAIQTSDRCSKQGRNLLLN